MCLDSCKGCENLEEHACVDQFWILVSLVQVAHLSAFRLSSENSYEREV